MTRQDNEREGKIRHDLKSTNPRKKKRQGLRAFCGCIGGGGAPVKTKDLQDKEINETRDQLDKRPTRQKNQEDKRPTRQKTNKTEDQQDKRPTRQKTN